MTKLAFITLAAAAEAIIVHRLPVMKNVALACVVFVALLVATRGYSGGVVNCGIAGCPTGQRCVNDICVSEGVAARGLFKPVGCKC